MMAYMSAQAELRCRCGEVRGSVANASSRTVNRVVCYPTIAKRLLTSLVVLICLMNVAVPTSSKSRPRRSSLCTDKTAS